MRKIYFLALFNLALISAIAQNFNWTNRAGLWAYDYGYGIVTDNAGSVYVAGKYEDNAQFGAITVSNAGNHDMYLAKYDAGGTISWVATVGGIGGDYARSLATDKTYLYVAGEIEGAGDIVYFSGSTATLTTMGDNDIVVAKYDLNGNLIWARSAGGILSEKAHAVTCDNAGNVYVAAHYRSGTDFGPVTINGNGNEDICLAKYDANGNFQWVQTAGGPGRDEPKSLVCDASGNVYMCGFYSNGTVFGSQTLSSPGVYYDTFLAKYSSGGSLQWVTTAGGNYDDVAWSMTMDNSGKIFVSGEFNASANFGSTQLITAGNADVYVACYDQNGNTLWAKSAGGALIDRARGIGCDGNNVVITGQYGSVATFGTKLLSAADSSDIFFASMDNNGNFISALTVGGQADSLETLGYESGVAICAEANGNVYATGAMLDGGVFGSTSLTEYGRTDMFVTKISSLIGIQPVDPQTAMNGLYPNPSTGSFNVSDAMMNAHTDITIFNSLGEPVYRKKQSDPVARIDISEQSSGVYWVEILGDDRKVKREKLVISK